MSKGRGRCVLVCGGRDFTDRDWLEHILSVLDCNVGIVQLIHGCAAGADSMAARWAEQHRVASLPFRPDWEALGKAAGPIRNQRMLDEGRPDLVIAFRGGRGTADLLKRAKAANIEIWLR